MSLAAFWFSHPKFWFNATPADDNYITSLYEHYEPVNEFEKLLWHDQISRHIARSKNIPYDPIHLTIAYSIAKKIKIADPNHRVFALLPLRHTRIESDCILARDIVMGYMAETSDPEELDTYTRFYKACISQLIGYGKPVLSLPVVQAYARHLLCPSCKFDETKNELENPPVFVNWTVNDRPVIISLSGGVDSMVCLYIAKCVYKLDTIAIHIDYNNREQSSEESQLISLYCKRLNVPLYIRYITEIHRTRDNLRDFYEKITHDIRFNSYRELCSYRELAFNRELGSIPVILGHNQTDCQENILHNIKKGRSIHNLKGMTEMSEIDGVIIYRPMLGVSKEKMYELARVYNIPYFGNSTPEWSERGITRTKILPVLAPTLQNGLLKLSESVSEMNEIVEMYISSIEITNNSFTLPKINRIVFEGLFKRMGINVSRKAMDFMMEKVEKVGREGKPIKISLNKNVFIERNGDRYSLS